MKRRIVLALSIYFLVIFYLVLPEPAIPHLPDSFKSIEPGDTVEIPGVSAYYTNLSRQETVEFYKRAFSRSLFLNTPLLTYVLNHPPEYARETIRDTLHSNFYEEIVHPLRESLFISGWTPSEDPVFIKKSKGAQGPVVDFFVNGQHYKTKITLFYVPSLVRSRVLIWTGIFVIFYLLTVSLRGALFSPWPKRR